MKNFKYIFYSFALVAMIITVGCKSCNNTPEPQKPPTSIITYESGAAIPDYASMPMNTFKMDDNAKIDEATAKKNVEDLLKYAGAMAEFDLANPMKENGMLWYKNLNDPSAILNVNLSNGDISLNRGTKAYMGPGSTAGLLMKDEAVKAAKEHLQKMGYWEGEDNSIVVGHVGGVNMATNDEKNGDQIFEKMSTVRFDRKLDNIPVVGHSRLLVQMGTRGMIQSLVKQWVPLSNEMVKSDDVVMKDDVKKSLEDHLTSENMGAKKIMINKINLIYYDNGSGMMEPALHIIGVVQMPRSAEDSTLVSYKHDMVEPILKNPKMSYTFKGEKHDNPKEKDDGMDKKAMDRSDDDKNKQ